MEKKKSFDCDICSKPFTRKDNMIRHKQTHSAVIEHKCDDCEKTFKRKSNLEQHINFGCKSKLQTHQPLSVQNKASTSTTTDDEEIVEVASAIKKRVRTFVVKSPTGDLLSVFTRFKPNLVSKIDSVLTTFTALKFNLFVDCEFINPAGEDCRRTFKTRNVEVYRTSNTMDLMNTAIDKITSEKEDCEMKQSGWTFDKILKLELRINKYNPLKGARFIQLPAQIANKKSVINVQNVDDFCFKYAILSKYVENHPERVSNYINNAELESKYNWNCVTYPVQLKDIDGFEKKNTVSINVFSVNENHEIYPLRVCKEECEDHFDLLFMSNETTSHYCYIKNFERLIHNQLTGNTHNLTICKRCFMHFDDRYGSTGQEKLTKHKTMCMNQDPARCEFPTEDIKFKNPHHSKKIRFVLYADFETLLEPVSSCFGNPTETWTNVYQRHVPYSFSYILKDTEDEYTTLRQYRGPDTVKHFIQMVTKDIQVVDKVLFGDKKLKVPPLTPEQQSEFATANTCHICKKEGFTEANYKVRNHCHVSGQYLGAAHRICNLFYQDQSFIACYIHNLSGYDGHFLIKELGYDKETIKIIPNTEEKYISFSKMIKVEHARNKTIELRFLDSCRFMPFSLSQLASNLPTKEFYETEKHFPDNFKLVTRKGVFPYEYISDLSKLNEQKLPEKSAFNSKLTGEEIEDEEYEHAKAVWSTFEVTSIGEYSDIYVKTDVLILCDLFEHFRKVCLKTYDLDPAYYFTVPGLAFDAMLKYTGVTLELMRDMDMIMMVEKGIRGGITQCVKKHAKANNKYLGDSFDPSKPSKYLMYLDANNLYGWALSRVLPYGGFEWCDTNNLDVTIIPDDAEEGYILEVDLEYPETLHDKHSDFAFCTEKKIPSQISRKRKGKQKKATTHKLLATVENKTSYVIHYVALKQALKHGLILKKTHRAIKFRQSSWMKPYIDLNTEKRKAATNEIEKDFYKLMINSCYGKAMESVRGRMDIRLVSDEKKAEKLIAKPNFLHSTIYSDDLVAIKMAKTKVVFNKPIYTGLTVLDLSKTLMYSFHYDIIQPFYKDKIQICYMDTDAFIYEIETDDVYKDFKTFFVDHLDTSDYPLDHLLHSKENKKVLGKFKDELKGDQLIEYVGLRSKMYAVKSKATTTKKLKGIKKSVIKHKIDFNDYLKALYNEEETYTNNYMITSSKHEVKTVCMNKLTLCPDDDKRVVLKDKINTLPYGHWRIVGSEKEEGNEDQPTKRLRLI